MPAPSPLRRRGRLRVATSTTALVALCLGVALTAVPASAVDQQDTTAPARTAGPPDVAPQTPPPTPPQAESEAEVAEQALADVQQILGAEPPAEDPGPGAAAPVTEDLSLALRDLALGLPDLDRADRRTARRLLARPTSWYEGDLVAYDRGAELSSDCGTDLCVHWVEESRDAPPTSDTDADGVPDQVELTRATAEDVWQRTLAMGYRPPLTDRVAVDDPDGRPRFDIYLADLGGLPQGTLYGYCAWEAKPGYRHAGTGYCVVDDDFSVRQFGGDPVRSLQETIAHELFHAVQFGYDALEDLWFMEASATWMEDELFDDANGNRAYLRESQLAFPGRPLDDPRSRYGGWVFLRWLSEKYGSRIVLDAWRQADSVEGPDRWGARAVDAALRSRRTSLARQLPAYATSLRFARTDFDEGRQSAAWRSAAPDAVARISGRSPSRRVDLRVGQLASAAVVVPTRRETRRMRQLVVDVDAPARFRGVRVSLVQVRRDGSRVTTRVAVDRTGAGRARVGFARAGVRKVIVLATGTSLRMRCWQGTSISCEGVRRDHRLPLSVRVRGR